MLVDLFMTVCEKKPFVTRFVLFLTGLIVKILIIVNKCITFTFIYFSFYQLFNTLF